MDAAPRRFVLLRHTECDRPHWDFLLEQEDSLATWQSYHDPLPARQEGSELFKIADHRKMYLDFEGRLSENRGLLERVCVGTYTLLEKNSQLWRVRLASSGLVGEFELRSAGDERWVLEKVAE